METLVRMVTTLCYPWLGIRHDLMASEIEGGQFGTSFDFFLVVAGFSHTPSRFCVAMHTEWVQVAKNRATV